MLYVIHGYSDSDHYTSDNGPLLEVTECNGPEEVEALYKEFLENINHKDTSHKVFRVIDGKERKMVEKKVITEWVLK
jgi:hypothetical protein